MTRSFKIVLRWFTALLVLIDVAPANGLVAQISETVRPDLAGTWILNRELSDEMCPTRHAEGTRGGAPAGLGDPRTFGEPDGFGCDLSSGRGGPSNIPNPVQTTQKHLLVKELIEPGSRLIIVQIPNQRIAFVDTKWSVQVFGTNGEREQHQLQAGTIETTARWDARRLVKEILLTDDTRVVESYALDAEHHRLVVTFKAEDPSGGSDRLVKRIYDALRD
jgi:hypothetical protein